MSESKFATSKDAKDAGWYSRRHRTREESLAARKPRKRGRRKGGRLGKLHP